MLISSYSCNTHNTLVLHVWRSLASAPHFYSVYLTLRMSAWRRHIAASGLKVAFAKTIPRCLSTMTWAVNTCLGIASNIESTSLLCWPSGGHVRHRWRMSSQVCSLYRCESGWSKCVLDIHIIWITYSSYRYGTWRVVIIATSVKI